MPAGPKREIDAFGDEPGRGVAEQLDCVVIGAGVVGLAVARALALRGREVVILEAADDIGTETSSRNSEVIHAGIYYPPGSLKAKHCVAGRALLYRYCRDHNIAHEPLGKLIVAVEPKEVEGLAALRSRALANGVDDLEHLSGLEVRALEPELRCEAALISPSTGIIDSHGFMLALLGDAEAAGAIVAFHSPVERGEVGPGGITLRVGGREPVAVGCRAVINSAGLSALELARGMAGLDPGFVPRGYLSKGHYLSLSAACPFRHLIYPMPSDGGLGVHLTLDLDHRARFGPDVRWVTELDYDVPADRAPLFAASIRRYWPDLPVEALQPAYAGIRPKLHGPEATFADFVVQGPEAHGVPGLVNLFGIESPGLTSSLSIAEAVAELILKPA